MPNVRGDKKALTVWIDTGLMERIDKLAEKADITRSKLVTNMIEVSVETLEKSQKVGLLQLSLIMRDMEDWLLSKWVTHIKKGNLESYKK